MQETQETWVWSLGWEDPLEEEMATHSFIPAWAVPGWLQSIGWQRAAHDRANEHKHTWLDYNPEGEFCISQWDAERQMGFNKLCKQRGPHRSTGLKAQQSVWGTISHCAWPDHIRQVWEWVWNKDGQRRGPREGLWFPGSATSLKWSSVWRGK